MDPNTKLLIIYGALSLPLVFIRSDGARFCVGIFAGLFISIAHGAPVPGPTAPLEQWGTFLGSFIAMPAMGFGMAVFATFLRLPYVWIRTGNFIEPDVPLTRSGRVVIVSWVLMYAVAGWFAVDAPGVMQLQQSTHSLGEERLSLARPSVSGNPPFAMSPNDPTFRAAYIKSLVKNCKKNQAREAKQVPALGITDSQIERYCSCVAENSSASITAAEIDFMLKNGFKPPPSYREKIVRIAQPCLNKVWESK